MAVWTKRELKIIKRINVNKETHENRLKILLFFRECKVFQKFYDKAVLNFKKFQKVEEKNED